MLSIFTSSTGKGVMLRVKSFLILLVPYVLTFMGDKGIAPEGIVNFINALFVVLFGVIQAYAWIRASKQ